MKEKIPFNIPLVFGSEKEFINECLDNNTQLKNTFSKKCEDEIKKKTGSKKAMLTPSATAALEMAALMIDIRQGDEIIMPSYTFVSTANAFLLRGAKIIFVDVNEKNMCVDYEEIKSAITPKTKAIVVVHYAGASHKIDEIVSLARNEKIYLIEDAAQAYGSKYKDKALGSFGDIGVYSFHGTKNINSGGEGGAIVINNELLVENAEIIREKGTDRSRFIRNQVDKYSWVGVGSSYIMSEISAAFLYSQLKNEREINRKRVEVWNCYYKELEILKKKGKIELPELDWEVEHNGHIFYIICKTNDERNKLMDYLLKEQITTTFHYVPLHSSIYGKKNTEFRGDDMVTTDYSERLLRLPLFYEINKKEIKKVISSVLKFYG